jgi:hypothetical protein
MDEGMSDAPDLFMRADAANDATALALRAALAESITSDAASAASRRRQAAGRESTVEYAGLDKAILDAIGEGPTQLARLRGDFELCNLAADLAEPEADGWQDATAVLTRRLRALFKAGWIDPSPKGWVRAARAA